MNQETFKAVLKAHWRSATKGRQYAGTESISTAYWTGRIEVMSEIYFDLFEENIREPLLQDANRNED